MKDLSILLNDSEDDSEDDVIDAKYKTSYYPPLRLPTHLSDVQPYYRTTNRKIHSQTTNKYFILANSHKSNEEFVPTLEKDFVDDISVVTIGNIEMKLVDDKPTITNLCATMVPSREYKVKKVENPITNFTVSTNEDTFSYAGVYLCDNEGATRIMKFRDVDVKKKLSYIVYLISIYDTVNFPDINEVYTIGVVYLDGVNVSMLKGGKSKKKRTRRKRSRKKTLHTYHRRRRIFVV